MLGVQAPFEPHSLIKISWVSYYHKAQFLTHKGTIRCCADLLCPLCTQVNTRLYCIRILVYSRIIIISLQYLKANKRKENSMNLYQGCVLGLVRATGTSDFLSQHMCWIRACRGRSSSCTGELEWLDLLALAGPVTCYFPDVLLLLLLLLCRCCHCCCIVVAVVFAFGAAAAAAVVVVVVSPAIVVAAAAVIAAAVSLLLLLLLSLLLLFKLLLLLLLLLPSGGMAVTWLPTPLLGSYHHF